MNIIRFNTQYIVVDRKHDGEKLFQFLVKSVDKNVPKSAIMKWIRTGQVRINGKRAKPYDRLKEGNKVRIPPYFLEDHPIKEYSDNPFDLKKVFENEDFLVLDKPPNLCVQPGKNVDDSVYDRLKKVYGNDFYLVHRLDKETSGLLLVAKTYSYLQYLQDLWKKNEIQKIYLTWAWGKSSWDKWTELKDMLEVSGKRFTAISYAKTLKNIKKFTLVMVKLVTGRKHQIRIQFARRNMPIVGDKKYGRGGYSQGLLLHACYMAWDDFSFSSLPRWKSFFRIDKNLLYTISV